MKASLFSMAFLGLVAAGQAQPEPATPPSADFRVEALDDKPAEGPERMRSVIMIGGRQVVISYPQGCQLSSSNDSLTLYLSNKGIFGQISVTKSPFTPAVSFTEQIEPYHQSAEKTLPSGSTEVEFKGATTDNYNVNERTSLAFDWVYGGFGRKTRRQVAFLNYNAQTQLCVTVVADEAQWKEATGLARRFVNSWYEPGVPLQKKQGL